jgi:hypothetical protein
MTQPFLLTLAFDKKFATVQLHFIVAARIVPRFTVAQVEPTDFGWIIPRTSSQFCQNAKICAGHFQPCQHTPRPLPSPHRHQHEHQRHQPSQHRPIAIPVHTTNQPISSHQRNRASNESWPITSPRRLRQLPSVLDNLANGRDAERRMAGPRLQHPQLRHIMYTALHALLTTDFVNSYLSHYVCSPSPSPPNSQIKNVDKSTVEASTYEGKLVFHDLHLEEGVLPLHTEMLKLPNCILMFFFRSSINWVCLSKSQNRKSRLWKCYSPGTEIHGEVSD